MKNHLFKIHYLVFFFAFASFTANAQKSIDKLLKKYNKESVPYISAEEVLNSKDTIIILDARELKEFEVSHLKNANHIGYDNFEIDKVRNSISKNKTIVVYCSVGIRSETIAEKLKKDGYTNIYNLYGGIFEWKNKDFTVFNKQEKKTDSIHTFSKMWGAYLKKGIKVYE